jgi:hypothetical protein
LRSESSASLRLLLLLLALLAVLPSSVLAQRIQLGARGEPEIDRFLAELAGREYTVIRTNQLITRNDTLTGTIVVARATIRLEGTIIGDLIGLDANVFLRPSAVVTGDVVNIAGGLYPSELATIHGTLLDAPTAPYRVTVTDDVIRIDGIDARPRFEREGLAGLLVPTYDRVNGLTARAGARVVLPYMAGFDPRLRGRLAYRTARRAVTGGVELAAERDALRLAAGAERTTLTNETWIRSPLSSSISYLVMGNDYHDHYRADRLYVEAERVGSSHAITTTLTARAQLEDGRTLDARNPWSLFRRDQIRPNRPMDDGTIASAILAGAGAYEGETLIAGAGALLEAGSFARRDAALPPPNGAYVPDSYAFGRAEAWIDLAMAALLNHTLTVEARAQGPLPGTEALPRQRWTMVGGDRTLYTYPIGTFHGDRLFWVRSGYAIPFPEAIRLPVLGPPTLELVHVAAMAWTRDEARSIEQNVGAQLRAGFVYVRLMIDPHGATERALDVGLMFPPRSRPWQRPVD